MELLAPLHAPRKSLMAAPAADIRGQASRETPSVMVDQTVSSSRAGRGRDGRSLGAF